MKIIEKPLLAIRTTMRLGGPAYQEIILETAHDGDTVLKHIEKEGLPPLILGGGSNIIATDKGMDAILLRTGFTSDITVIEETPTHIVLKAPLSVSLQKFVLKAIALGAEGFEGLAGVPGTLGGAIAMNAGSFGCETTRFLTKLQILSLTDGITECFPKDWTRGYRTFSLKNHTKGYLGISAEFTCLKKNNTILKKIFINNMQTKKIRQPLQAFSAGCIFKNPLEGLSAGRMLEAVGMKTIASKNFAFSKEHANFLIHTGKGSIDEVFNLLNEALIRIEKEYACTLEKEVRFWL